MSSCGPAGPLSWPSDPHAVLGPLGLKPAGLKLDAPVPCKAEGISYWSAGGPAKVRVRVLEDAGALKLAPEYTVGLRFCVGKGGGAGYDTVLLGHDNKHWLAVECGTRRLCCVNGKTGESSVLDYEVPHDSWVVVFLQPREGKTAVFTIDDEGLLEVGAFSVSLMGSRLEKMGWAENEVQIAEVALWGRCTTWTEMAAVVPAPPRPPAPTAVVPPKVRSSFRGQVVDVAGRAVPEVRVSWGARGCSTDEDGCFSGSFSDAETEVPEDCMSGGSAESAGSSSVLSFALEGFAPTTAHAQCTPGGPETSLRVTIRPISASAVVDVAAGGSVVDPGTGSSVTLPPNALCHLDGTPVEGPVTLSLSVIDVTDPAALASMPGDFSAVSEDGSTVYLQSLGAVWVGASDESGRELAVRKDCGGVDVDIRSRATANAEKLGADAEMWSFNEDSGKWELQQTAHLKVNGEVAPNSAAKALGSSSAGSAPPKKPGPGQRKQKVKRKTAREEDVGPPQLVDGCMSPENFRQAVRQGGEKSLSTKVDKLGYINCDLAYHHPQRAVMLTGIALNSNREPLCGVQLWSVGKDYCGRCPDVTDADGRFGKMIAQFDSQVDIEVHVLRAGHGDDKIDVYFEEDAETDNMWDAISSFKRKMLERVQGKYIKEEPADPDAPLSWVSRSDPQARIIWSQGRRLWQHEVGGVAIFRKPPEGEDIGTPFGTGWQLGAELLKGVGAEHIRLPVYMRPMSVTPAVFGPFATGPPGEFVDVGELVVQD